ncbi:DNA cytosine methyltransferase [Curvibacter sp. RS43]|uniref:DNA cytosine methyltransferase n=1 Tax=Curvibacter microcysteis TaxID=3026419 RepID=UPI00235FA8D2|nr:DNA cytosine methyltransferase [Curvibacter sp. RS43]MDD0812964.1 DNA cytosine methyltransferase [Curvibacter sp. RS43]
MHSEEDRGTFREDQSSAFDSESRPRPSARKKPLAPLPKIVSLFAGAGGLDLGFKDAGFTISIAIDLAPSAIRTHKRNFPRTHSEIGDLIKLQPIGVLELVKQVIPPGERIAVIGGPPCQGFSRANAASLASDPRNKLPKLYVEIVQFLQKVYKVDFIVFENVLGIRDKKHVATFNALKSDLKELHFDVTEQELCAVDFGVPQNRRRVILSGMRAGQGYGEIKPRKRSGFKTVREVLEGLPRPTYFQYGLDPDTFPAHPNHWTMQPKSLRFANPEAHVGDGRSFKRLKWDEASPTIAFGHREIHVHPNGRRRLSIYEALLLQGFPPSFVLEGNLSEQVAQVSNAVPPPLARSVANAVKLALRGSNRD